MKFVRIIFLIWISQASLMSQNTFVGNDGVASFYSYAPLEDIEATNKKVSAALNISTSEVVVKMFMVDFHFDKSLMEEHFNENYIESDKYPTAVFQGTIATDENIEADGTYQGLVSGDITIHGVTKPIKAEVELTKSDKQVKVSTKFKIKTADHGIKVPRIVIKNIAEVIDVSVEIQLISTEK